MHPTFSGMMVACPLARTGADAANAALDSEDMVAPEEEAVLDARVELSPADEVDERLRRRLGRSGLPLSLVNHRVLTRGRAGDQT